MYAGLSYLSISVLTLVRVIYLRDPHKCQIINWTLIKSNMNKTLKHCFSNFLIQGNIRLSKLHQLCPRLNYSSIVWKFKCKITIQFCETPLVTYSEILGFFFGFFWSFYAWWVFYSFIQPSLGNIFEAVLSCVFEAFVLTPFTILSSQYFLSIVFNLFAEYIPGLPSALGVCVSPVVC